MMKHTQLPWSVLHGSRIKVDAVNKKFGGILIGDIFGDIPKQEQDNANKACNAHYDLLDACQTIANMDESRKGGLILDGKYAAAFITIAKQAIAKATKEDT